MYIGVLYLAYEHPRNTEGGAKHNYDSNRATFTVVKIRVEKAVVSFFVYTLCSH